MSRAFDGAAREQAQHTDHPGETAPAGHNFPIGLEPDALCRTCGERADAVAGPCAGGVSVELAERARACELAELPGSGGLWRLDADVVVWMVNSDPETWAWCPPGSTETRHLPSLPAALLSAVKWLEGRDLERVRAEARAAGLFGAQVDARHPVMEWSTGEALARAWRPRAWRLVVWCRDGRWLWRPADGPLLPGTPAPSEAAALRAVLAVREKADAVLAALVPPAPVGRVSPAPSPSAAPAPTAEPATGSPAPAEVVPSLGGRPTAKTIAEADVLREREKQRQKRGDEHDDLDHDGGALAAAAAYLAHPGVRPPCGCREAMCPHVGFGEPVAFPAPNWAVGLWRKHSRREQLVVAAALCLAEVERLDRSKGAPAPAPDPRDARIAELERDLAAAQAEAKRLRDDARVAADWRAQEEAREARKTEAAELARNAAEAEATRLGREVLKLRKRIVTAGVALMGGVE